MNKIYKIISSIENEGFSFDDILILSFLSSQWDLNKDIDSKSIIHNLPRYSKSTIHRKLNQLRIKSIIEYQVDYEDGRKIKIIKGSSYQKVMNEIDKILANSECNVIR